MTDPTTRRPAARILAAVATAVAVLAVTPSPAGADPGDEQALAEKYAPVVRLVPQAEDCGPGEPFRPVAVDPLFDNPEIALRGPWTESNLVTAGPSVEDLSEPLYGYSLDFPGNPLRPGCDYEEWFDRLWGDEPTTVYAHVATEADQPGRLALEYWFYYPFNDFNNKHESDWETIQVEFDVGTAAEALTTDPVTVLYSQHEAGEESAWDDPKLALDDGTHPEVFASAGSHSNHYASGLFLLRSGSQGLGCDSTLDAAPGEKPVVVTIPSNPERALREFPWTGYQGHWGEQFSRAFYSGPLGPSAKDRWDQPFTATEDRNEISYQVPGGDVYGVKTTDAFCSVVERGSVVYLRFTDNPLPVLLALGAVVGLVVWLVRRTAWGFTDPFPLAIRRTFGQVLSDSWQAYRSRVGLYLGIGSVQAVAALGLSILQQSVSGGAITSATAPPVTGWSATLGFLSTLTLTVLTLFATTATIRSLLDRDQGTPTSVWSAYRRGSRRAPALIWTAILLSATSIVMVFTLILIPVALVLVVAAAPIAPVVVLDGLSGIKAVRRSARLVRTRKFTTLALMAFGTLLGSVVGGFVGVVLLAAFQVPFVLVNAIPGMVAGLLTPLYSLALTYFYEDTKLRLDEQRATPEEPAGVSAG
jgi:hypothetical protein